MALNISTFKTRAATAGVFVLVMLAGMLWNHWSFFILFSIVHFGCWIGYQKLVEKFDPRYRSATKLQRYGVMLAGWCIMLYFTNKAFAVFGLPLQTIGKYLGLIMFCVLAITGLVFSRPFELRNIGYALFGLLYISLGLALLVHLRCLGMRTTDGGNNFDAPGFILPLGILVALWINDTMAYLVGSFIGKTPFSKIPPKKTWEGTIGGAILCVAVIAAAGHFAHLYTLTDCIAIASIVAFFGILGDLFESKLKRMAGVKDSGSIMPGHGGFLDRFDSLLLAAPFAWLYVVLFVQR